MINGVAENFIAAAITHTLRNFSWKFQMMGKMGRCRMYNHSKQVRISLSTILRIAEGDRYLLVLSKRRPDEFGPFGGVGKYFDEAGPNRLGIDDDRRAMLTLIVR